MTSMRILQIVSVGYGPDRPESDGVSVAASLFTRALARSGADVTLFAVDPTAAADRSRLAQDHAHEHYFRPSFASRFNVSRTFAAEVWRRVPEFSVVHIHGLWRFPSTVAAAMCRRAGIPYVLSPHGMLNDWAVRFRAFSKMPAWYAIENRTVRRAAGIHFCSDVERVEARRWTGGIPCEVVPVGPDTSEFEQLPPSGVFRAGHGISADAKMIGFLGRLHPVKGLAVLLRALPSIAAAVPDVVVALAGPDENGYRDELQALASQLGIAHLIKWIGPVYGTEKLAFLSALDVFVLPSFSENLGLAALEAMAAARSVVLGSGVNIAAEVEQAGAGWSAASEPQALADAISRALLDTSERHARAEAGRRFVVARYGADTTARRMLAFYSACVERTMEPAVLPAKATIR
jgi:glycosyltransferase involved in cell wall biosynthesis